MQSLFFGIVREREARLHVGDEHEVAIASQPRPQSVGNTIVMPPKTDKPAVPYPMSAS